jgi:hypothetical protein
MGQRTYEHPDYLSSDDHFHVKMGMYQPTMSASAIPMKSPVVQLRHFLALQKTSPKIPMFFPSVGFWIPLVVAPKAPGIPGIVPYVQASTRVEALSGGHCVICAEDILEAFD